MIKSQLMGILNITPDSFYDGQHHYEYTSSIDRGIQIYHEGADILDIGGESTRPGSLGISAEEELRRVIPVIKRLKTEIPIPISIDTSKYEVARQAVNAGASIINDVSGLSDTKMQGLVASSGVLVCVMHMQNSPATMQAKPTYSNVVEDIIHFFNKKIDTLLNKGIRQEQIILDPGIGFGKTLADNIKILHHLQDFKKLGMPVLIGHSRKSFQTQTLQKPAEELLPATLAISTLLLKNGVDLIRVHDIAPHRDIINLMFKLNELNDSQTIPVCV